MGKRKHRITNTKVISKPTPSKDLISIIIPVYGRFDILPKCLEAIPNAVGELPYNIIMVDNSSPEAGVDEFYRDVQSKNKNVSVIRNKENYGFPFACNIGAKRKTSSLILFLNSDVVLAENAIANMAKAISDPKIGVVGAKLVFPYGAADLRQDTVIRPAGKVQHVGLCTNIRGDFYHVFIGWNPDHPKVKKVWEVYAVTGAALMTKRNIWNAVGGFDLSYGLGTWEDIDYCMNVRDLGYNVIIEQTALGEHYTGATAEHYRIPYPMDMNRFHFMSKWASKLNYTELNHL